MRTRIYSLLNEKGEIQYIGKTNRLLGARLADHIRYAKLNHTHKDRWMVSIFQRQILPTIQIVEIVDGNGCKEAKMQIAYFRSIGVKLTKIKDGWKRRRER